ncbi:phosphotransferase [Candidatus Nomurabacteria bacterium]|nr:phosphotransferase [Candidatus Nomurabacteria bacterium]
MDIEKVKKIFEINDLVEPNSVKKIEVGFTNKVYSVDDKYILKVCDDEGNEYRMAREVYLYKLFSPSIPVPEVIIYDTSKSIFDKHYVVYPRIKGENLYNVWHKMDEHERKQIVKELCNHLRAINETPYNDFVEKFDVDISKSWREIVVDKINVSLEKLKQENTLVDEVILGVRDFVEKHQSVLDEAKMAFVHWDTHFDNVLVEDGKIVAMLDFERIEVSSIDYVLDIVKRMQELPSKYMSEYAEQFVKDEDYAHLIDWFREYAPELFAFNNLNRRLDLYALRHDLDTLTWYPEADELKESIEKMV